MGISKKMALEEMGRISAEAEQDPYDAEARMALDEKAWAEGWDSHLAKCLELEREKESEENPNI